VPARALAVARCTVKFTDGYQDAPAFPLQPFPQDGGLVSATKQLYWHESRGKAAGFSR